MKEKVVCAMSGGIDSSVAAALLKQQGFEVIGVFMKLWLKPKKGCDCSFFKEAEDRARLVAWQLDIPFYVIDLQKEFKKEVINYFIEEYEAGLTPNPCVVCNKEIKIGLLLKKAKTLGADKIATGHYLRSEKGRIFSAKDKEKDQSYFLWQLSKKELEKCLFPLAKYTKKQVVKMAEKFNFPVSSFVDSQEVCFVDNDLAGFLKKYIKVKPGKIIDLDRNVLGKHKGLHLYTIGQRKGINLSVGPYFVVKKDIKNNNLVVSKNEKDLLSKELYFYKTNWISGRRPKLPLEVKVKIRYRSKLVLAIVKEKNLLVFKKPQRAVTSGQSVVFYSARADLSTKASKDIELLGGGIIK